VKFDPAYRQTNTSGFTLLEVLLGIGIAIGLFVVALHFYRQAADLRTQLIEESERLSSIRLVMDRVTTELRAAFTGPRLSFRGDSNSLEFVTTGFLSRAAWAAGLSAQTNAPETDLKLVRYGVMRALEGTNLLVTGFSRSEQTVAPVSFKNAVAARGPHLGSPDTNSFGGMASKGGTSNVLDQASGQANPSATDAVETNQVHPTIALHPSAELVTEGIRFVRFRFWDGSSWSESWEGGELPQGVEFTIGSAPLREGEQPEDYSDEYFRRVIYLPGGPLRSDDLNWVRNYGSGASLAAGIR